jgi:molybdenum cofactor cytidylyltransferase
VDTASRFPCILLAAGASRRMGRPKQLLPIGDEAMVRRTARIALDACSSVVVVAGAEVKAIAGALEGLSDLVVLENRAWAEGMVGSAQVGAAFLRSRIESGERVDGFFVHHGDMPFVGPGVFAALLEAWDAQGPSGQIALAAARDGRAGHPVLFPIHRLKRLLDLGPGERLKAVLETGGFALVETGCDGVLEDIDGSEDYRNLLEKYGFSDFSEQAGRP